MFVGKMSIKMVPIMSRGFDCLISWKYKYCFNKPQFCSKSNITMIIIRNTASPSHLPPTKFALADSCSCCLPSTSSGRFSVTSFSVGRFADLLGDYRSSLWITFLPFSAITALRVCSSNELSAISESTGSYQISLRSDHRSISRWH